MATYRAKPFKLQVYSWDGKAIDDSLYVPTWLLSAYHQGKVHRTLERGEKLERFLTVQTPSGDLQARVGDWVTMDAKGNLGVIRADDFYERFEKAA